MSLIYGILKNSTSDDKKQTHRYREETSGYQWGVRKGEEQ